MVYFILKITYFIMILFKILNSKYLDLNKINIENKINYKVKLLKESTMELIKHELINFCYEVIQFTTSLSLNTYRYFK